MHIRSLLILFFVTPLLWGSAQPKKPIFYRIYADYGLSSDKTTCTFQDHQGFIWIGTEEGLNRFISYYRFEIYKPNRKDSTTICNDYITSIYEDSKKNLWVGTLTGLNRYNRAQDNFHQVGRTIEEISNKSINAITELDGALWVGTTESLVVIDIAQLKVTKVYDLIAGDGNPIEIKALKTSGNHIWVGTSSGLYNLENKALTKVDGFEDVEVNSLETTNDRRLLVGTEGKGMLELDINRKIKAYHSKSNPSLAGNVVNDIEQMEDGLVWIGTNRGLSIMNRESGACRNIHYDFNNYLSISDHTIRDIYQDENGSIWLTTPLGGINYYHALDNQFDYFGQMTSTGHNDELLDYNVLSLLADKKENELWIGTRAGISKFNETSSQFKHFTYGGEDKENFQIIEMLKDPDGSFWLGTPKGLYTWTESQNKFIPVLADGHFADRINALFLDDQNQLWVGTREKGLKKMNPSSIEEYDVNYKVLENQSFQLPHINDIIQDPEGRIWIGTANGLFYIEDGEVASHPISIESQDVKNLWVNHMYIDQDNLLMLGTRQEGLIRVDKNGKDSVIVSTSNGLPSNDIRSVIIENDSVIWAATNMGLSRVFLNGQKPRVESFYIYDGLQGNQFTAKASAFLDRMYFGGLSGLTAFNPDDVKLFELPLKITLRKLYIEDEEIKPGSDVLNKSILIADSITLAPDQNTFTLEFNAMDFLRPDSIRYEYMLENYDKEWLETKKSAVTYTNLPRGKEYIFKLRATSRMRQWSDVRSLYVKVQPFFYDTLWFKFLLVFFGIMLIYGVIRVRDIRNKRKQRKLEELVTYRTKELHNEIDEKKKTAEKLRVARDEAEKANRIKSEFLANISHEIRTPLNGILGLTHLVSQNEPNKENLEMLEIVHRSASSLKDIINDLLDLSKIEAGKFEIINKKFSIRELLESIIKSFEHQANEKSVNLKLDLDDNTPDIIIGDDLRLKQILVNLISNAIKFTEQGDVTVKIYVLKKSDDRALMRFSVQDTGIGIPSDKIESTFSSFTQIDNSSKRQYGGTGLGLAICKELTKLMGGTIWAESVEGEGSEFQFELSLPYTETELSAPEAKTVNIVKGCRILLVEDNMVNTMVARKMLKKTEQNVDTAGNGKIALEKLEENTYDLILMDIQMPVMDGMETTLEIRKSDKPYSNIPIVALTAGAMKDDREKCLAIGMNDFLSKPFEYKDLEAVLEKFLNKEQLVEDKS